MSPALNFETFKNPLLRYIAPFAIFMLFTACQDYFAGPALYWFYAAKIVCTLLVFLLAFRGHWQEIEGNFDFKAVVVGLVVLAIWIYIPHILGILPSSEAFNATGFSSAFQYKTAIAIKLFGAAFVVPIIEELFWRSFLLRYFIQPNFLSIKLGTYNTFSFWAVIIGFTLEHRFWEWPAAILTGIIYGAYCIQTKNLKGCIIAHGATNLGLGIYVLATDSWMFW